MLLAVHKKERGHVNLMPSIKHGKFLFPNLVFLSYHPLHDFQAGEFFPVLFVQRIGDILHQRGLGRNGDILQRVGALLCLFDIACQPVCGIFHHGELYGKVFHFAECLARLINRFMRIAE